MLSKSLFYHILLWVLCIVTITGCGGGGGTTTPPPPPPKLTKLSISAHWFAYGDQYDKCVIQPSDSVTLDGGCSSNNYPFGPNGFTAIGTYDDGKSYYMPNATWEFDSTKFSTPFVYWNSTCGFYEVATPGKPYGTGGAITVNLIAKAEGYTAKTTITFQRFLDSFSISPNGSVSVKISSTLQFTATCKWDDGKTESCSPSWSSSDKTVGVIGTNGLFIPKSTGFTTISGEKCGYGTYDYQKANVSVVP